VGVLMETEIWPNLLAEAQRVGVPTVLANGRLNERSARQARRFAALLRPAAQALSLALAQTEADAARILAAGVNEVVLAGNLKFDMSPSAAMQAQGREWRERLGRPVVALMNSREGEEALLLAAWRAVYPPQHREGEPASGEELRPLLLIVPRHPQRFTSVSELAAAEGFRTASRTAWGEVLPDSARAAEVWVGDSLGEMAAYYSLADVALLGGSFLPLGGHNLIEAAANGCPLILGPSTFNFAEAAERALKAGAALRAADMRSGLDLARHMLGDPAALATIRGAAFAFSAAHQGAATRMAKLILEWADRGAEKSDSR
jgi:3-deoxy-D-manno-octulosonic-acid transferase